MPRIAYRDFNFRRDTLETIARVNDIVEEYAAQGFDLTLRQVYYQFVQRGWLPNTERSYKKLGAIVNDGRLAGMIDWLYIVDRTRALQSNSHWDSPEDIMDAVSKQFRFDKWADQDWRIEVWIEKDALKGVFWGICSKLDIPLFSCRGYTSQSEMWAAGRRLQGYFDSEQTPLILHFGDHDPSGIDMTRDIDERLGMFMGGTKMERLALNMDQVEHYFLPPNPAKVTDSRFDGYRVEFGDESWELDALEPRVLVGLVEQVVLEYREDDKWAAAVERENAAKRTLSEIAGRWDEVVEFMAE
jgi:hypothetical protein